MSFSSFLGTHPVTDLLFCSDWCLQIWLEGGGTVLVSPVVNSLWFGMPVITVLPAILIKSVLLAGIAGYVAARFGFIPVATTAASNRNENIS